MNINVSMTFASLVILAILPYTMSKTTADVNRLIANKTKDYNKNLRPVFNQDDMLHIDMALFVVAIQEFNEVSEKFSVVGFLEMFWKDELLAWDPKDFGNVTTFAAGGGYFWRPNIVLINGHDEFKRAGKDWDVFRFFADGRVAVSAGDVFDSSCQVDITYYPWDEQTCALKFMPWGYDEEEIQLVSLKKEIETMFFNPGGAWDLIGSSANFYGEAITYIMNLRRKPKFVFTNVILPVVFMSVLNMLVFLIPVESGERISYCLTVLLAIAVFLTLVGDTIPKTSDPMSLLSYYLLAVLAISVCIILATVISLRIYFRDEKKSVPKWLTMVVRCLCCKSRRGARLKHQYSDDQYRHDHLDLPRYQNGKDNQVIRRLPVVHYYVGKQHNWNLGENLSHVSTKYPHWESRKRKRPSEPSVDGDEEKISWKDVSLAVDMLFFFFFLCSLSVASVLFFCLRIKIIDNKWHSDFKS